MSTPILVITGPSGVGKGTLIKGLLERVPGLELAVSATTRKPRASEFGTPEDSIQLGIPAIQ